MSIGKSAARVLNSKGACVGGGVLLRGQRIATAAHCANLALGSEERDPDSKVGSTIDVDFPSSEKSRPAKGAIVGWSGPDVDDIAIVQLVDPAPGDTSVPLLDDSTSWANADVMIHGYPGGNVRETKAELRTNVRRSKYSFFVKDAAAITIEGGYSGGPVYLPAEGGAPEKVVGLTLSFSDESQTGTFVRMADVLKLSWGVSGAETNEYEASVDHVKWILNKALIGLTVDLVTHARSGIDDRICDQVTACLALMASKFEHLDGQGSLGVQSVNRPSVLAHQVQDRYSKWNDKKTFEDRQKAWELLMKKRRGLTLRWKQSGVMILSGEEQDELAAICDRFTQLANMHPTIFPEMLALTGR